MSVLITDCIGGVITGNRMVDSPFKLDTCDNVAISGNNGDIEIDTSTNIAVSGNAGGAIHALDSPQILIDGNQTWDLLMGVDGPIVVDGCDDAVVTNNTIRGENTGTATAAIVLKGTTSSPVVKNNTYQGLREGDTGTVYASGLDIAAAVTGAKIGFNQLDVATSEVLDNGTGTLNLDLVPFTFGTDANPLTVGGGVQPFPFTGTGTIVGVRVAVGVAPSGSSIIVDLNVNGSSLWTAQGNQPAIAVAAKDSGVVKPDQNASLSDGDVFTVDIDQIGSGTAGGFLTVVVYVRPNGS